LITFNALGSPYTPFDYQNEATEKENEMQLTSLSIPGISHTIWSWMYAESCLLIICSSVPPLNILLKRLLGISSSQPMVRKSGGNHGHRQSSIYAYNTHTSNDRSPVAERRVSHGDEEEGTELRTLQAVYPPHRCRVLHGSWLSGGSSSHPSSKQLLPPPLFPEKERVKKIIKTVSFSQDSDTSPDEDLNVQRPGPSQTNQATHYH
jgi:hypothetical protein